MQLGTTQQLTVVRSNRIGLWLDAGDLGEVLLPAREAPPHIEEGGCIHVFLYPDSEDRPTATVAQPLAQLGEVAYLKVVSTSPVGAFLDWGLPKDLLLPFGEQRNKPREGSHQLIKVISDREGRPVATAKLDRHLEDRATEFKQGDAVDIIVAMPTELGYKVAVNNRYWGLLSSRETRTRLRRGERLTGYVQRLREDQRLSISLNPPGAAKSDEISTLILQRLEEHDGFIALNDKSTPETIFNVFGCSKGAFKQAIGKLYKARKIVIEDQGIRLAE